MARTLALPQATPNHSVLNSLGHAIIWHKAEWRFMGFCFTTLTILLILLATPLGEPVRRFGGVGVPMVATLTILWLRAYKLGNQIMRRLPNEARGKSLIFDPITTLGIFAWRYGERFIKG